MSNYPKSSNSLVYRTNKVVGKKHIYVKIRLDDECKNGHQDFAITGDIYEAGRPKTDKYHISGGCIHETIAEHFPEFKPFIDLHLADYMGNPMYAIENGYYHLKNGFNDLKPGQTGFAEKFCEYYRINSNQFVVLETAVSSIHYAILLIDQKVPDQWKKQADKAIAELERLTETNFIVDSKKTQLGLPAQEKIDAEIEKLHNGYYSPEAIEQRKNEAIENYIQKLRDEHAAKVRTMEIDLGIDIQLYRMGGERFKNAVIFYNHSKEIKFNWSTEKLTQAEIDHVKTHLVIPEGVTYRN